MSIRSTITRAIDILSKQRHRPTSFYNVVRRDIVFRSLTTLQKNDERSTPQHDSIEWINPLEHKRKTNEKYYSSPLIKFNNDQREYPHQDIPISVIPHTLLSSSEIINCLTELGGEDIRIVNKDEENPHNEDWDSLIVCTALSYTHIRTLTNAIVTSLRARKLGCYNIIGATFGVEGGKDILSKKRRRKRNMDVPQVTDQGYETVTNHRDDGWMIVDCQNYIVHVQDEITRRSIDLESLWSFAEKGMVGYNLRTLENDSEVDEYVTHNPVPEEYVHTISGYHWNMEDDRTFTRMEQMASRKKWNQQWQKTDKDLRQEKKRVKNKKRR